MEFLLGEGEDFIIFLAIGWAMAHCKRKTIKTFVLWDAPQLIKLINMNHNYKKINTWTFVNVRIRNTQQ
jgi:hypothetical protein